MLTLFINFYCPKVYHRPDHSLRIVEYHRNYYYVLKPNIFTETQTQDNFRVTLVLVISLPKHTTLVLALFFYRA
jgi:hypothetical protein